MSGRRLASWRDAVRALAVEPPGVVLRVPRGWMPSPRTFRMTAGLAWPEGQRADYRKLLRGGRALLVADFGTHYEARLERAPGESGGPAAVRAPPGPREGVALGALLAGALGRSRESALVGAALGGLLGALGRRGAERP
jgi:hypothetical protein